MSSPHPPDTPAPDPPEAPDPPGRTRAATLLLATALASALVVSVIFGWAWREREAAHEEQYRFLAGRLKAATEALDSEISSQREMLAVYATLQEQRLEADANRLLAEAQVKDLRARLKARAAELEAQLPRDAASRTELAEALALAREREKELDAAREEIEALRRELATVTSRMAPPDAARSDRESRISWLRTAVAGRPSAERRSILESAIPSIPEGIATAELLELIEGMESADVRGLLETVHMHVAGGADRASLLGAMAPDDAAAIAPLFDAGKK